MPIVKPMPEREDNGLYKSPASNPFKIYSFRALYGGYPNTHNQWEYAYRFRSFNWDWNMVFYKHYDYVCKPSINSLWLLADYFEVDIDYLVGRKDY